MNSPITTKTARGRIVLAKLVDGRLSPKTFANWTVAERAAIAAGPGWQAIRSPNSSRVFLVALAAASNDCR